MVLNTNASTENLKLAMATQLLMDDNVREIAGPNHNNISMMAELLFDYHRIDPKAVLGAQHMVDFFTRLHTGPDEFALLVKLCHQNKYNFVLLARGLQLGMLRDSDIQDHFRRDPLAKPFDFDDLEQKIKARGIALNQPE